MSKHTTTHILRSEWTKLKRYKKVGPSFIGDEQQSIHVQAVYGALKKQLKKYASNRILVVKLDKEAILRNPSRTLLHCI